MRSPADRRALEWGLRAAALALLVWLIVLASLPRQLRGRAEADLAQWETMRAEWAWHPPADSMAVVLSAAPAPAVRDWLVALRRSGTIVGWSNDGIPPVMLEVEPRQDPAGGLLLRLAGPSGATVSFADGLGVLDTVVIGVDAGSTVRLPPVAGPVIGSLGNTSAWATSAGSDTHRRILLLGLAGWEARFVAAALEERGWVVDARYAVAPGIDVSQGAPMPPDTARYSAVIVLDSAADRYAGAIGNFVRSGGGLVLTGRVGAALRALTPGTMAATPRHAAAIAFEPDDPRRALSYAELRPLVPDAVPLEVREGRPVVAGRRVGAGRVVQSGYRDSWRWRMSGGEGSVAAHRAWWADLVAGVAYAPAAMDQPGDPAPFARLVDALGAPTTPSPARPPGAPLYPWLVAGLFLCLLLEWTSRRLRGAR